jgi:hypothetical protein
VTRAAAQTARISDDRPQPVAATLSRMATLHRTTLVCLMLGLACASAAARSTGPARPGPVDIIVIHSTGGPTCDAKTGRPVWVKAGTMDANMRFIEAHPTLGIHHMIDRDGTLRSSVPEDQVGHHVVGWSERSIAIELINDGDGVDPFPPAQLQALVGLIRDIARRRGIGRQGVKRHSDLDLRTLPCDRSMRRKVDPGAAFPFEAVLDRAFPAN